MPCPKCGGLVVEEYWQTNEAARGWDALCLNCGWRQVLRAMDGYEAMTRPLPAKGALEYAR